MSKIEQIKQMLRDEPDDVFLNYTLGLELAGAGRHDEAVGCFEKVLALDRSYWAAYMQLGRSLIDLGRRDDACRALQQGAEVAEAGGDLHASDQMKEMLHALG